MKLEKVKKRFDYWWFLILSLILLTIFPIFCPNLTVYFVLLGLYKYIEIVCNIFKQLTKEC